MPGSMSLITALEVLRATRTDQIVVTTMGTAREWPRMSHHPLDFHFVPSSMGQAPALGLGLALAQPRREVLVLNGDGCMLMNAGVLATITASRATNFTLIVFDNGIYEVTGGQQTAAVAGRVDYPALARAMGFAAASVSQFEAASEWQHGIGAALAAPGPRFISLRIAPCEGETHLTPPGPMPERMERFRKALAS